MNRIYCPSSCVKETVVTIVDRDQLRHMKVLRLEPGEKLAIFDERGAEYDCVLTDFSKEKAVLAVERARPAVAANVPAITVAVAIPKKSKIDDIVEKLTQLGCDRVVPLITQRVIVRAIPRDMEGRHQRWEKIAFNASQQSQRNTVCAVDLPVKFEEFISRTQQFDLKLIPTLEGERRKLREVLVSCSPKNILVLIGPEGDFIPGEIAAAAAAGFIPVSFGKNVLRVETACLYVTSALVYQFR